MTAVMNKLSGRPFASAMAWNLIFMPPLVGSSQHRCPDIRYALPLAAHRSCDGSQSTARSRLANEGKCHRNARLRSVPFLHVKRAISGKYIWEQIVGKQIFSRRWRPAGTSRISP